MSTILVYIAIDDREDKKIIEAIEKNEYKIQTFRQRLPLADFIILDAKIAEEKPNQPFDAILALIERKTYTDYAASIRDGRGKEQSLRLSEYRPHVYMIVEGKSSGITNKLYGISQKVIEESITRKRVHWGFNVIRTFDYNETAAEIARIALAYANPKSFTYNSSMICKHLKSKKDMKTPMLCFIAQLRCIPSVSEKIATKIAEKYGTMTKLIDGLKNGEDISTLKINETRKIGSAVQRNLCLYFGINC